MPQANGTFAGFTHGCKGFRQNIIQLLAVGQPLLEFNRFIAKFFVA